MNKIITIAACFFCIAVFSQVTNSGKPLSWVTENMEDLEPVTMPQFDLEALRAEDERNKDRADIPWRFGYEFLVDHNLGNSGTWHTLPDGGRIWRIRYRSAGAKTMNFLFSDFYMPKGATLYLYNNGRTDLLGAYDAQQNNEQRVLGTWLVKGEDIWLEYYEPADVAGRGRLEIFKLVHGYRAASDAMSDDQGLNTTGDCMRDVDCPMPDIQAYKDINKKAVALILVGGSYFCSGALINNTNNDGKPYFLTANHCYSDPALWAFRFNWISPNPVCGEVGDSTSNAPGFYQTSSGANLVAKYFYSDFCLVEIPSQLPALWDLVWLGWDHSDTTPASTFSIHHPAGDIMKVNRDLDQPLPSIGLFWTVENWEMGANAGGSSGSPLFDNNGRVIGQLKGGSSGCNGTSSNNLHDIYGRFGISWEGGGTPDSRLKDWLDPAATGAMTADYYIRPDHPVDVELNLESLLTAFCTDTGFATVNVINAGTEPLQNLQLSYSVNSGPPQIVSWTGNLMHGDNFPLQLPPLNGIAGQNSVEISVVTANGVNDPNTSNNTVSGNFNVLHFGTGNVHLHLHTDYFGNESSWELQDANGALLYSDAGLSGDSDYEYDFDLSAEGCYNFIMSDQHGDGMCCSFGPGVYRLTAANGALIAEGSRFGFYDFVSFRLFNGLSLAENALQNVNIYPNPSQGLVTVEQPGSNALDYVVYNVLGQETMKGTVAGQRSVLDITAAPDGVYIIKLEEKKTGRLINFRLIKE
ncbi:T9SS type A sorting domain-containing protein [Flavobacterium album]|nr:T9SS type A sorting domain-containing protein [Flavobacterium album]